MYYLYTIINNKKPTIMTVSNILNKKQFNKAIESGIYTILESKDAETATKDSKEYEYYKVEYINPALYKSTFFVAIPKN